MKIIRPLQGLAGILFLASFAVFTHASEVCKSLVVVGMEDERAIAAGEDAYVIVGTANAAVLRERLQHVDWSQVHAVYSFGVAGGLDPTLAPGSLLLSTRVIAQQQDGDMAAPERSWESDPNLLMSISLRASRTGTVTFRKGVFLGTDFEARDNPETGNKGLREKTGADIIDNESHIAAAFASENNLPFVSVRAVSDSVNHKLPPAALLPLDSDGSPDGAAIAKSLLMNPLQIPALVHTARDYQKALAALKAFRKNIGFSASCK